jgi:two-component system nitrogen regulation sensor histidine kinase NtrY
VIADKDQIIRVFSNLLKNAVQSMPDSGPGKIEVKIEADIPGFLRVSVSDNGIGIPEDQRDKIFTPNFTTKSSGMGLGLAMVKNIIENSNGNVLFSSVYGEGTTFFVSLPKAV